MTVLMAAERLASNVKKEDDAPWARLAEGCEVSELSKQIEQTSCRWRQEQKRNHGQEQRHQGGVGARQEGWKCQSGVLGCCLMGWCCRRASVPAWFWHSELLS
mmetsp:Transcript_14655/g.24506  ORF Transcript_14655/g.24506 Transcript_14655/m.24506 type:complete len:103 (+) Transcript_14655:201-509(+)